MSINTTIILNSYKTATEVCETLKNLKGSEILEGPQPGSNNYKHYKHHSQSHITLSRYSLRENGIKVINSIICAARSSSRASIIDTGGTTANINTGTIASKTTGMIVCMIVMMRIQVRKVLCHVLVILVMHQINPVFCRQPLFNTLNKVNLRQRQSLHVVFVVSRQIPPHNMALILLTIALVKLQRIS